MVPRVEVTIGLIANRGMSRALRGVADRKEREGGHECHPSRGRSDGRSDVSSDNSEGDSHAGDNLLKRVKFNIRKATIGDVGDDIAVCMLIDHVKHRIGGLEMLYRP